MKALRILLSILLSPFVLVASVILSVFVFLYSIFELCRMMLVDVIYGKELY